MKTLVIGGTGTVGSQIVADLVAKGSSVRVLTRSNDRAKDLPNGVGIAIGDLNDPVSARSAFEGIDAVFMLNGVTQTEANEGIVGVALAMEAKAKRFVYMSVHNAHVAPYLPHFGSKIGVEAAVKKSGIPFVILQPNNFFQNDLWLKEAIVGHAIYPQPLGHQGIHRVDTRDIADAAVNALGNEAFLNKSHVIVGPAALTGESCAEAWGNQIGKKVTYAGDNLEAWEKQAAAMMPPWMLFDMKMMFRHFQEHGLLATQNELAECEKIVGHTLRSYDAFVAETASTWKK